VPEIFTHLRREIIKRKPYWLCDVLPYLYVIAIFLALYLIHQAHIL